MQDQKTEAAETDAKSPDADKPSLTPFQKRFDEQLQAWKKDGCQVIVDQGKPEEHFCGAKPHRVMMDPVGEDGNVTMIVDCQDGHARQWEYKVPEEEMKGELARQKEAMLAAQAAGGKTKDPMIATVTIKLDLRTQEVTIDPWVPTPGVGLQLGALITAHFAHEAMSSMLMKRDPILTPQKGIINPKTGRPFVS